MEKTLWIPDGNEGFCRDGEGYLLSTAEIEEKIYISSDSGIRVWEEVDYNEFISNFEQILKDFEFKINLELNITDNDNKLIVNENLYLKDLESIYYQLSLDSKFELLDLLVGSEGQYFNGEYVPYGNFLAVELNGYSHIWDKESFFAVDDMDSCHVYEWWDGSNWRIKDNLLVAEYQLKLAKASYSLDIFDGRNKTWGGAFSHALLKKVAKVDAEDVEGTFLWWSWTQMQGQLDTGELMSSKEVVSRLKEENHPNLDEITKWLEGSDEDE